MVQLAGVGLDTTQSMPVRQMSWVFARQLLLWGDRGEDEKGAVKRMSERTRMTVAYENLPRKKAKFINFAKNSLNLKADREGIAEKLWELIAADSERARRDL